MPDHDASEFTFAFRADTGERVYIPKSHLDVFRGSFRLSQRQQTEKAREANPPAVPDPKKEN